MTDETRRVLFASRTYLPDAAIDNIDILRASIANNAREGISSALMKTRDRFYQLMEGPPAAMGACLDRIEADQRHYEIDILLDQCGDCPLLKDCPMVYVQCPDVSLQDAGIDALRMAEILARLPERGKCPDKLKDAAPVDRDGV